MRLTEEQHTKIRDGVQRTLGDQARVWLFGSRVDDVFRVVSPDRDLIESVY